MMKISSIPHSEINEILDLLFTDVKGILNDQFIGMYLFGSLANGDFDQASDIDVLFVTKSEISKDTFSALKEMHAQINQIDSPWAIQLEVSYIPREALHRFDPNNKLHPHMDRGDNEILHMMSHESDWIIQRHMLREHGIVITGPDLKVMIDPVSVDERRRAVANVMPLWTDPILENPSKINKRGYQSYCVLSLCRMLYTLKTGDVISKRVATEWAMENIDPQWTPLIERAWIGRQNSGLEADPADIQETLEMMRYTLQQIRPTPYPEVNEVLKLLLSNVKEILGDQFVGMYLYGSLSSGDFNSETSDIDFIIVMADSLSDEKIMELELMHRRIWASGLKYAARLEGAYVPKQDIRRYDPNQAPSPTINEGKFYVGRFGSDWIIQRHIVREYGVIVEGPDPKTLIEFVTPDDIRGAVIGVLRGWWFPMLNDPSWLRDHENVYRSFAVITMCRALHALEHGTIVSKPKAVQWACTRLEEPWQKLIDKAVTASNHHAEQDVPLDEILHFIQFTMEQL